MATPSAFLQLILLLHVVATLTQGKNKAQDTVIIVSLDGMGWQYISGQFAQTPNLDLIAEEGVKARYLKNVFPTKTWPNHHTILTGLYPESHGIVSNSFWDPVYEEKFVYDYDCSASDPKFYNTSEPIWLTFEKQGGRSAGYFWPGSGGYLQSPFYYEKPYCLVNCSEIEPKDLPKFRNKTRSYWPPYIHCMYNYSEAFPSRIDKVIDWLKSDKPPRFVALYVDEPDWKGHDYGSHSNEYKEAIEMVDRDAIGYLVKRLRDEGFYDQVNLIFVSDHSFNNISSSRQIFLDDFIQSSSYTAIETGAVTQIWPNERMLEDIYRNLTISDHRGQSKMKVYRKEHIPDSLHWKTNRRIPPILIVADVGWTVARSRGASNETWVLGTHGWQPDESQSYSIFFARGPAFRKNYEIQPFNTVDLYPLMCHLLRVEPKPNNGSFDAVKAVLVDEEEPPTNGQKEIQLWVTILTVTVYLLTLTHYM